MTVNEALRETASTLLTTSNTTTMSLIIALILFGIILGLFAALLIYWMDRRQHCAWCHPGGNGTSGICLKHARQFRRRAALRRAARKQQTGTYSLS